MRNARPLAALLFVALAACGGGASVPSIPSPSVSAAPSAPGPVIPTANLTLHFPAPGAAATTAQTGRAPVYLPPSAATLVVIVNAIGGNTTLPSFVPRSTTIALTTTGTNPPCSVSGSVETCTVAIPAPPGSVNYTFDIEDGSANILASATQTLTIVAGSSNTVATPVTLLAMVKTVTIGTVAVTAGVAATFPLALGLADADGNAISGAASVANPITLTDSDTTGATKLSVNGGTPATTVIVNAPSDVVALAYNGSPVAPFSVAWSGAGITAASLAMGGSVGPIVLTGTTVCTTSAGCFPTDADYNAPTLFFEATGAAFDQTLTISETGWSNPPFNHAFQYAFDPGTCTVPAGAVATLSPGSPPGGTALVVTPVNAGICKLTITDFAGGQSSIVWLSVSTSTLTGNAKNRAGNGSGR
jgi:hypothetical protein